MTAKEWKKVIIKNMKEAGTYQKTFDAVITTLAETLERRDAVYQQFVDEGSQAIVTRTSDRGAENSAKNPLLVLWMELNRDALAMWRDCGLTPSGLRKLNESAMKEQKQSALEKALLKMT